MTMNDNAIVLKIRKHAGQFILILAFTVLSIAFLLPFCWTFATSLRLPKDSFKLPPSFFPTDFVWQNYAEVFTKFPFATFIKNSIVVTFSVVILNIIVSTMAAFAFSRLNFRGRDKWFLFILAGMMIPVTATIIPVYVIVSQLGLVGSKISLIVTTIVNPMSIFLIRQSMLTIPRSYDEAAYIDGASRWTVYWRIITPMCKSSILMSSMLVFIASWNDFLRPLIYLSDWDEMTLPIGLKVLQGYQMTGSISVIFAGVIISLIVPVLLYVFGQKYLVQSVALSGLKS